MGKTSSYPETKSLPKDILEIKINAHLFLLWKSSKMNSGLFRVSYKGIIFLSDLKSFKTFIFIDVLVFRIKNSLLR